MKQYIVRNIVGKQGVKYKHEYTDKRGNVLYKKDYKHLVEHIYIAPAYDNVKINLNQRL